MSAAVLIGCVAILKLIFEVASEIQARRAHAEEEASRAPIPVHAEGALPGEDLASLPELNTAPTSAAIATAPPNATERAMPVADKDLFDPAEFLVVARRRMTPQRDLFDPMTANVQPALTYPSIPEDGLDWVTEDSIADAISVEDEIYAARPTDDGVLYHPDHA